MACLSGAAIETQQCGNQTRIGQMRVRLSRICGLILTLSLCIGLMPARSIAADWVYSVRSGDTLWDLCLEYTDLKTCWLKVGPYNGVDYPKNLAPGTRIKFPVKWLKQAPSPVIVNYILGQATKTSEGDVSTLVKGDALSIGAVVKVSDDGLVSLLFADGSLMVVEGGSEVRLDVLSTFRDSGMVDSRVHLRSGTVQTTVPKRTPRSRFEVSTPSAVAAVRGTDFRVSSGVASADPGKPNADTYTRSEVFEGGVAIAKGTQDQLVPEGFGLIARANEPLTEAVKLLPPPVLVEDSEAQMLPHSLSWQASDLAGGYKIVLEPASNDRAPIIKQISDPTTFIVEGIRSGCYLVYVSAIDKQGFQGMPAHRKHCYAARRDSPTNVTFEQVAKQQLTINWDASDVAETYVVDVSKDSDFSDVVSKTVTTSSFDLALEDSKPRYVRISSVGEYDTRSEYSQVITVEGERGDHKGLVTFLLFVVAILAI